MIMIMMIIIMIIMIILIQLGPRDRRAALRPRPRVGRAPALQPPLGALGGAPGRRPGTQSPPGEFEEL